MFYNGSQFNSMEPRSIAVTNVLPSVFFFLIVCRFWDFITSYVFGRCSNRNHKMHQIFPSSFRRGPEASLKRHSRDEISDAFAIGCLRHLSKQQVHNSGALVRLSRTCVRTRLSPKRHREIWSLRLSPRSTRSRTQWGTQPGDRWWALALASRAVWTALNWRQGR